MRAAMAKMGRPNSENTGTWLTASASKGDTSRADHHYYHTVYWNDNAYDIEFFFSTDWNMSSTSDDKIFSKSAAEPGKVTQGRCG